MAEAVLFGLGAVAGASVVEALRVRRLVRRLGDVAMCSHELRGALTAIGLAISGIERSLQSRANTRLGALRHAYERALLLARDLEIARGALAASRVVRPETFDLQQVVGRVVEGWNASAPIGRGPVVFDWRAGTALVHGYPLRLTQALDNLVANAVEHGRGRVTVLGRRAGGGCVSVSVLDRGAGPLRPLDGGERPSWRASRGHGLVVVRHAVELHGGTVRRVQGPFGAGVEVRLPAGAGAAPIGAVEEPRAPTLTGPRALSP